jgi:hypothetical protein
MSLTEEERRRIYEEEKARIEAQSKIKQDKRTKGCLVFFLIFLGIVILFIIIPFKSQKEPYLPSSSPPKLSKIYLKVKEAKYQYGYFTVHGIAENVGNNDIFSPTISMRVYGSDGTTILAEDLGWPAGHYLKKFEPGTKAAFRLSASVPGEPPRVKWEILVKDCPYDVKY